MTKKCGYCMVCKCNLAKPFTYRPTPDTVPVQESTANMALSGNVIACTAPSTEQSLLGAQTHLGTSEGYIDTIGIENDPKAKDYEEDHLDW